MLTTTSTFPLVAGIGPTGGLAIFFSMGMVAAVNPCGFAMLPAYLSYFLGLDDASGSGGDPARAVPRGSGQVTSRTGLAMAQVVQVARALRVALTVSAGFMTVFGLAGLAVVHTPLPVFEYAPWVSVVIGLGLAVLGIAMVLGFELSARLPRLDRGGRDRTMTSMYVFGMSYAIASIGCTLPFFVVTVTGTMNRDSLVDGLAVFGLYGAGMALVLSGLTVAMALARTSIVTALRSARAYVNTVAGVLVALAGAYVTYYGIEELRTYRAREPGEIPSSPITDIVNDWSTAVSDWIDRTGVAGVTLRLVVLIALLAAVTAAVRRFATASRASSSSSSGPTTPQPARTSPSEQA